MHLFLPEAQAGPNLIGLSVLIIIGLVVLSLVDWKFPKAYEFRGKAGTVGCIAVIVYILIRVLIHYYW